MLPGTVLTTGNFNLSTANEAPDMLEVMVQQLPHEVASNLSQRRSQQNLDAYIPGKV